MDYQFPNADFTWFVGVLCKYRHIEIEGKIKFINSKITTIIFTEICLQ
jgi:hypothetical protein